MHLPSNFRFQFACRLLACAATFVATVAFAQQPNEHAEAIVETACPEPTDAPSSPPPFGGPLLERTKLTGDWFCMRSHLRDSGVTLDINTTQYYQGVTTGGLDQAFRYGGRNDYFVNLDGEKLGFSKGSFAILHGETRYGESANPLTGAIMPTNLALALPQPNGSVSALTGVKFMQFLSETKLVFAGKINTFDDFKQPLTGAGATNGFQNTALMINPVFARTVPYSTYGAGFVALEKMEPVFTLAVFDTNNTPLVTGFESFFNNGVTILGQANKLTDFFGLPGHQGLSGTYSTGSYTNLSPTVYLNPRDGLVVVSNPQSPSWSLAYNADQALYVSPDDPRKRWGLFGNLGIADNNPSPIRWFANAGLSGTSPFACRTNDTFGVGYFYVGVSDALKTLAPILLPLGDEQGVELYYNYAVTPWCQITPDIQVINPFRERIDTSLLIGMRAKIEF